jgi:tRNA threonylcarbamoyladenosine biosynthesis protein TsaB
MKRMLAVETSAEACSVALAVEGELRERFEHAPLRHAELILPMVSGLLDEAGLRAVDLDAIAFGRGPGSFTSLRIGIGVVQGLAWGAERPVVPVSSLASVAQAVVDDGAADGAGCIVVAMDARMGEVFHAAYRVGPEGRVVALGEERVSAPEALNAEGDWLAAGNGFSRYDVLSRRAGTASACLPDAWPRASAVLALASAWLEENEPLPPALAQPVYIRNDVAEKPNLGQSKVPE